MNSRKTMRLCFMVLVFGTSLCAYGAAEGGTERPSRWLPVDEEGWTVLRPAADSRLIYVSSSVGDDDAARFYTPDDPAVGPNPFRPEGAVKPYRTVRSGLAAARDGYPDWVLLKRGDAWYEPLGSPPNGRSTQEPSVIGAYGEGPRRPQLRLRGKQSGLRFHIHDGFWSAFCICHGLVLPDGIPSVGCECSATQGPMERSAGGMAQSCT
jgi:hypothetical protein